MRVILCTMWSIRWASSYFLRRPLHQSSANYACLKYLRKVNTLSSRKDISFSSSWFTVDQDTLQLKALPLCEFTRGCGGWEKPGKIHLPRLRPVVELHDASSTAAWGRRPQFQSLSRIDDEGLALSYRLIEWPIGFAFAQMNTNRERRLLLDNLASARR